MSEPRLLNLYPYPNPELVAKLRTAKQGVDLPLVKPREAFYGSGRVIATETPPFITEYALVTGSTEKGLQEALAWALGDEEDDRANGAEHQLSEWLGGKVTLVATEGSRVKFKESEEKNE